MEMTDVYWRLISYYLNLAASQKSIRAHFAGKGDGMGWDEMGWVAGSMEEEGEGRGRIGSIKETEGRAG